ncbi:PREDICTED: tetratricopeptide repeat protein 4 [Dinoponera quadriceps]|uniref:Tetratricopeptide repeat protein 4 n=1 Tax=Dinoponera quadriceps TaxID=609295 RepID=A0A6P3XYM5_DINQU|nr:PREDICTED: tetratricopeptide repeat protein 4 [Dinoponera quadriceps]XP_014483033.1 PREDICTED: tetratricopeptide repeat protein 4 [Dinoponera quadriceps]
METCEKKKTWTDEERSKLAAQLDAELSEYMKNLEKKEYTEGWPEDRWQEEMEKHPFFMKKAPEPGDELSPLMEGLQQLKYGEDENTPEELANNYKDDGNFNFKYKKYHLAIFSYTEGIKTKCNDKELMAQLYNNRAAAHFMLKNYRSSLNDCKLALNLKHEYPKALNRAATCSFHIRNYGECIELCDRLLHQTPTNREILKLRNDAVIAKGRLERDQRKQAKLEKALDKEGKKLLEAISKRSITILARKKQHKLELSDLEHENSNIQRVQLDENNRLLWPVLISYPERMQCDLVNKFHEDTPLMEQLIEIFKPLEWDKERKYIIGNVNVYFEGNEEPPVIHAVDIRLTLGEILQDERFVVRNGAPMFFILVKSSQVEEHFLRECVN